MGRVLSESLRILGRNVVPFAVLAFLVYLPLLVVNLAFAEQQLQSPDQEESPWASLLGFVLPFVLQGAVAYGVFEELRGSRAPFLACVSRGMARLGRVLGVAVLLVLAMSVVILVPSLVLMWFDPVLGIFGALLGLVFLVVLTLMWYVAVPAAVVEPRTGALAALGRSVKLTEGSRGSIFGVIVVLGLLGFVVALFFQFAVFAPATTANDIRVGQVLQTVFLAVLGAWQAIAAAVAYHDLRVEKEGIDAAEIARVFD